MLNWQLVRLQEWVGLVGLVIFTYGSVDATVFVIHQFRIYEMGMVYGYKVHRLPPGDGKITLVIGTALILLATVTHMARRKPVQ